MKKSLFVFTILFLAASSFVQANDLPERIMGCGTLTKREMVDFLLAKNRNLDKRLVEGLIDTYIAEAAYEGVNHDIAFAQMCYHTQYLSFAGTFVKSGTYNYCGLASLRTSTVPHRFEGRLEGVRAHIQHLKGYATTERPRRALADPRYHLLRDNHLLGTAPVLHQLSNKWAGPGYDAEIRAILRMAYRRIDNVSPYNPHISYTSPPF
jgi:hypothetical protein